MPEGIQKMATKTNKKPPKQQPVQNEVDVYARAIQLVALFIFGGMVVISAFVEKSNIPVWATLGILGVAVGLSPEQILDLIKDLLKGFVNRRNG